MLNKPMIIYHANCADGFGAAWAAWRHFNRDVELVPATYGKPPPDVTGREVYIVDFSYPRQVVLQMHAQAKTMAIIDHHKTAIEDLWPNYDVPPYDEPPSGLELYLDLEHSGAMLAWKYFFGALPPPELLLHIEDRDLWKFALPNTRPIQAALFSYPQDIVVWDELMSADLSELAAEGKAIERKYQKDVKDLVGATRRMGMIAGYNVPIANVPWFYASDVGAELGKGHSFAATYYDDDKGRKFSLRSDKEAGIDVSEIAKKFGGGGHKNASGFSVPKEHELASL